MYRVARRRRKKMQILVSELHFCMKIARRRRKILGFPALLIPLKHCFLKANRCFEDPKFSKFSCKLPPRTGGKFFQLPPPDSPKRGGKLPPPGSLKRGGSSPKNQNFPPVRGGSWIPDQSQTPDSCVSRWVLVARNIHKTY